jgi:1-acyl-sn-glycerol-3-phosphate acyltransferase
VGRIVRLVVHLAAGLLRVTFQYPRLDRSARARVMQRWSRQLLGILGVELAVTGEPPGVEPGMEVVVANHVSWLDIFVISAVSPCRFVAKAEIRRWPVIGYLSERAGTLFVERSRRHDAARVNATIRRLLTAGERLAVFPEGTTTDGTELKIFHPSLLQPAVEVGAPVHPAALRYRDGSGALSRAAPYAGDVSFAGSLGRLLREPYTRAEIVFCSPIDARGLTRHTLARASEQAIAAALNLPLPRRRPGTPAGPPGAKPSAFLPTRSPYRASPPSR